MLMQKCKRVLVILLAVMMIGCAVTMAAAEEIAVPANANAFAFALQAVIPQEGEEEAEEEEIELTAEQAYEMATLLLPIYVLSRHVMVCRRTPNFLLTKMGKSLTDWEKEYQADMSALFEENGWDGEISLYDLYFEGTLEKYVGGIVGVYKKAMENNFNFLISWLYGLFEWFYLQVLPPTLSMAMLLPYGLFVASFA